MTALSNKTLELVKSSMAEFVSYWEENASETPVDQLTDPITGRPELRNAETAMEMLYNYIEERGPMLCGRDFKLLAVEQPFAVPLDEARPELIYIGRFDKVFKYQGRIYIGEHKTTTSYKKDGPFRFDFVESFSPNSQVDGYLYAAHLTYGDAVKGCWIDAALVHASVHDGFRFIPIDRHLEQLTGWVWETRYWISQIEANASAVDALRSERPNIPYMAAFPKNTTSCTNYGGCPYLDMCKMWSNPEHFEEPDGFAIQKWEPFDELELAKAKRVLGIDRKVKRRDVLYDNTRVQSFRVCPRAFYYRHIRHFQPLGDRRALLFGGAWHRAMDRVWTELSGGVK